MNLPAVIPQIRRLTEGRFLAALLILFVALSVQYTLKVLDVRDGKQERSAILRWRDQLLRLDDGEDIYKACNYPNPPIMALLLRPLADLSPLVGALVWYYLKVGMALAAFALCFGWPKNRDAHFPPGRRD